MEKEIRHLAEIRRFEAIIDGHICYADYEISDGALVINRTYVPKPLEGRGIASRLVAATYAFADETGLRRSATCPYAAAWLQRYL